MTTTTEFTEADLPELPEKITVHTVMPDDGWYGNVKAYDHFQMRTYALAAVAASRKKLAEQEPVAHIYPSDLERFKNEETFAHAYSVAVGCPDEKSVPVYAAPMPQANESEAVKALRELHDAWADNSNDLPRMAAIKRIADRRLAAMKAARAVLAGEPGAKAEQPDYKAAAEQARAFGAPDMAAALDPQPKRAQAMDEREAFHDWFDTYADPHSGRVERNIKRKAAWDAWQARAALAQAQASGKAAPTIDRNAIIEECAHALERFSLGKNSYEQGINEGFRLAAKKLRGMIKNC